MTDFVISEQLDGYLSGTRLSMNQVAKKWGVSAPLLSQIKNGKKSPSLELGLKILREAGASLEERKRWMEERYAEGHELGRIYKDERKERVECSLRKSFSDILESNPVILDIFLDISFMKDKGLSWNGVFKNYGEYGLELIQILLESGLVKKTGDRYFIVQDQVPHAIDTENSFGVMKSLFETLKQKVKRESFRGEFYFDLTDISPQGYQQLKNLNLEYTKKMVEIIKNNEMPRMKGGLRIIAQNLVSVLKCFAFIAVLGSVVLSEKAQAQGSGLTGGGSGKLLNPHFIPVKDLRKVNDIPEIELGFTSSRQGKLRVRLGSNFYEMEFKKAAFATPFYETEEELVQSVVELNRNLEAGQIANEEARFLVRNLPTHCKDNHRLKSEERTISENVLRQGHIRPTGFKVINSYTADGKPRFSAVAGYYVPCLDKE